MKNWKKSDSIKNKSYKHDSTIALLGACTYTSLDENSPIKKVELFSYKNGNFGMFIHAHRPIKSAFESALKQQDLGYAITTGFSMRDSIFDLFGSKEEMAKVLLALKSFQTTLEDEFIKDVCTEFEGIEPLVYPREKVDTLIRKAHNHPENIHSIIAEALGLLPNYPDALMAIADSLYEKGYYKKAAAVYKAVPKENPYFISANEKLVTIGMMYGPLPENETERLEALFCNFMNSGQKEEARRVLQHDLMQIKEIEVVVGSLDGTPQSYLELVPLYRRQNEKIEKLQKELKALQSSMKGKEEQSGNTPAPISDPNRNFGLTAQIAASSSHSPIFTTRPSPSTTSETTIKQEANRSPSPQG
ncbi:MAG: hypothetical protein K0R48_1377 [Gammaproteobacteria bacterium]|jgi:TolA-binding protein|nr:hypothetical protein [Gammaproteobacteria bacterium]